MGTERKAQTFYGSFPPLVGDGCTNARNLYKKDLGGVIFGCKHSTMKECLSKQLFGLPHGHYSYVRNIGEGLPLFLFNYSDRKMYGIYEAASCGQMSFDVYAWTTGGLEKTPFPAQVYVRIKRQCAPLDENQFGKVISDNYYTAHHFYFELDHAQARALISLFKPYSSITNQPIQKDPFPKPPSRKSVSALTTGWNYWKDINVGNSSSSELPSNVKDVGSIDNVSEWEKPASSNGVKHLLSFPKKNESIDEDPEEIKPVNDNIMDNLGSVSDNMESGNEKLQVEVDRVTVLLQKLVAEREQAKGSSSRENFAEPFKHHKKASEYAHSEENFTEQYHHEKTSECTHVEDNFTELDHHEKTSEYAHIEENLSVLDHYEKTSKRAHVEKNYTELVHHEKVNGYAHGEENFTELDHHEKNSEYAHSEEFFTEPGQNHATINKNTHSEKFLNKLADGGLNEEKFTISDLVRKNAELQRVIEKLSERTSNLEMQQVKVKDAYRNAEKEIQFLNGRVKELESKALKLANGPHEQILRSYLSPEDAIYLMGGFDGNSWLSSLECFHPFNDVIKHLQPMSYTRSYAASAALDGVIYVFGGGDGDSWFDSVECYNPILNNWTLCPPMLRAKGSLGGVTLNGKIYAIGGGDGLECFSDVDMFDPIHGSWSKSWKLLTTRFCPAAAAADGAIYAVGGYDGNEHLRSVERLDPREGFWAEVPSMNVKRECHSVVNFNEKLYCMGGYDGENMVSSLEIFDPRLNTWIMGEPLNTERGFAAATVVGHSIIALGGVIDDNVIVNTVECYREGSGWIDTQCEAVGGRCFCSAAVI